MTAFYFGDPSRPLFGRYFAPTTRGAKMPAVVLCSPFGEEAVRSFKSFHVLAERLSKAGAPVMRFDYYGSGDSGGDGKALSLASMADDILEAHEELRDMSLATQVIWVGLRLGASGAAIAALQKPSGLGGLIAWEPILSGAHYLEVMRSSQVANIRFQLGDAASKAFNTNAPLKEYLGFPISEHLVEELETFRFDQLTPKMRRLVWAPASHFKSDDEKWPTVSEHFAHKVDEIPKTTDPAWNSENAMNSFVVPILMIDQIVKTVETWR
ncbi:MAG: alpha/beta fold hydrolase [Pseudomonadota bacterium]